VAAATDRGDLILPQVESLKVAMEEILQY